MKRYLFLIMATLCLSACATGRWESRELVRQRNLDIRLEQRIEEDRVIAQRFSHPAMVEPALIETLLGGLYYPEAPVLFGASEEKPVFQSEEIDRLAAQLSAGLAKATSNERVRFTSLNRGGGLVFKDRRQTKGVLFVDADRRINIAFLSINEVIEPDQRPGSNENTDPLEIEKTDTPVSVKVPYLSPVSQNAAARPMWVRAELEALRAAAMEKPAPAAAAPAPAKTGKESGVSGEEKPAAPPAAPPAPAVDDQEQLRAKLKYLKQLHEEGLIDKNDYEAKKRELLEQIK